MTNTVQSEQRQTQKEKGKIKLSGLESRRGNRDWKRAQWSKKEMKRQRGKDGVSSATLAGRLSPGMLPTSGRDSGGGVVVGYTAEERKGQRVIDAG